MEERGFAGVQIFGSGFPVVWRRGVAACDEAEDIAAVVFDGEGDAVAELVDESAGGRGAGDPCGKHLNIGDAMVSEVGDEGDPACGCVSGLDERMPGQVGSEAFGQIGLRPGAGESGREEVVGELVDVDEAFSGDGAGPPCVGAIHLPGDVRIRELVEAHGLAEQRGHRQLGFGIINVFGCEPVVGLRGADRGGAAKDTFRRLPAIQKVVGRQQPGIVRCLGGRLVDQLVDAAEQCQARIIGIWCC